MPKHDFMTPKAISNRMKSIGLQKLRWYCQMCQKQCRDENGFKCHTTSEGHLRQMRLFSENAHSTIDSFSKEFERGYLETLSHRHGTKRVLANRVYQEYIGDKHHIHMNATMWTSLTGLCKYLGKEGKAVVDETEKGWYIQYIDRDPKMLARQQQSEERHRAEVDDEERRNRMIEAQIAAANEKLALQQHDEAEVIEKEIDPNAKVELALKGTMLKKRDKISSVFADNEDEDNSNNKNNSSNNKKARFTTVDDSEVRTTSKPMSHIEKIKEDEERRKLVQIEADNVKNRKDYWLHTGIQVKIVNKDLAGGKYFKAKGVVENVLDHYVGEVRVENALLRLDQEHLQTVIPKVGQLVMIVNGRGRGLTAVLTDIQEEKYQCSVRITSHSDPLYHDRLLTGVEYEDISKIPQ